MQPATEPGADDVTDRRRDVARAGHVGDAARAREGLSDPAAAVRSTALGALDRLGVLTDDELAGTLADPDPGVRRRATELAASRPEVAVLGLLDDPDPSVVEMTAWSLGERTEAGGVARLSLLSAADTGHPDPLCREAAVAALDDKPAIRRRAAVALAAFEGPEVDAALHRCLDDRDWQVRQVAEDLLDV